MPERTRTTFFARISLMPGISLLMERVPIRPIIQGTEIAQSLRDCASLGHAMRWNEAGGGSVSHIASIAAIFIFWFSPAV